MNRKILGCLGAAAVGDAMGAATESKSTGQILEMYGKRVTEFQTPPDDVPARGRNAGQVTDAFSIPWFLTEALIRNHGKASREVGEQALMEWSESEYFEPFAGMTTRKVIHRLNQRKDLSTWDKIGHLGNKLFKGHYYALSSNGSAVKAYPAALLNAGDTEKTICDTVELTMASHDDPYSVSGACAIAAAVSEALHDNTTVYRIIEAAAEGSRRGEELARAREDICTYPGPSVTKRIGMAVEIAIRSNNAEAAFEEIRDLIGSGPAVAETVPAALGLIAANRGNLMESIYDAVNIGDETSTIACIVGAVLGAYHGIDSLPAGYLERIEAENHMDLCRQARDLEVLCRG